MLHPFGLEAQEGDACLEIFVQSCGELRVQDGWDGGKPTAFAWDGLVEAERCYGWRFEKRLFDLARKIIVAGIADDAWGEELFGVP